MACTLLKNGAVHMDGMQVTRSRVCEATEPQRPSGFKLFTRVAECGTNILGPTNDHMHTLIQAQPEGI